jgi:hypothetical protein
MFFPAFRILAPVTLQWAALEEHRRADTRAVMYGVLLDVKYVSGYPMFGLVPPITNRRNMF